MSKKKATFQIDNSDGPKVETAFVVHPLVKDHENPRELEDILEEADGLARAIGLDVLQILSVNVNKIQAGSFFGKGTREELASMIEEEKPDIVIVNHSLSPVQQRNLETQLKAKVIDRTGLILEIFGARAQTKEGRLQVELAALQYQRSRLVRSWTHLERQRGGAGFMGGPGERQIEIDRRLLAKRLTKLKKELEQVRRTRDLGRQSRARVPYPVIALVGYTNAGKSTLFNTLTGADVYAEDLPFATLDPTLRRLKLETGQEVILSDTVGFIADLPTHLVESFRATLEQINHADVILHVIDASRPDFTAQRDDVIDILKSMNIDYDDPRIIEVMNKMDAIDDASHRNHVIREAKEVLNYSLISAAKQDGLDDLLEMVSDILMRNHTTATYEVALADGRAQAWLHSNGHVISSNMDEERKVMIMQVELGQDKAAQFTKMFSYQPV